ncbi:MAG TPA: N-acetylmuramoyl-L-alanine amidase [Clostridia bacterium]|nr:N-acetylmuramoyl-L-alanine amidase [Clostridia bacterium]
MIIVMRKSNVILIGLIFALLLAIYSLNMSTETKPAATDRGQQKTVVIDAGHGGEDPGKISSYSDIKEKDLNLKIAFKVKELLESDNYKVIMTREEDKLVYSEGTTNIYNKRKQDLTRRKDIMDSSGAQIVVSIHMNSFPQSQYYGAQTFYPPYSPDSLKLANSIQDSLKENIDKSNKRAPQEKKDQIVILTDLKTPTAIVECGFLSNPEEERRLGNEDYQAQVAAAIKKGIDNYFK